MNILFLGGDKRYIYMAKALERKYKVDMIGFDAYLKEELKQNNTELEAENTHINTRRSRAVSISDIDLSKYDIVIFPISGINDNLKIKSVNGLIKLPKSIFENINKNTKFFTGLKTKKLLELIPKEQLISFLDYEEVKKENDLLTIERCS